MFRMAIKLWHRRNRKITSGTPGLTAGDIYRPLTEASSVQFQGFTKWDRKMNKTKDTDI